MAATVVVDELEDLTISGALASLNPEADDYNTQRDAMVSTWYGHLRAAANLIGMERGIRINLVGPTSIYEDEETENSTDEALWQEIQNRARDLLEAATVPGTDGDVEWVATVGADNAAFLASLGTDVMGSTGQIRDLGDGRIALSHAQVLHLANGNSEHVTEGVDGVFFAINTDSIEICRGDAEDFTRYVMSKAVFAGRWIRRPA